MKPERWNEVDEILQSVLERVPTEREAYLREVCAGDEGLCREVLTLMASHEQAGSFMAAAALEGSGGDVFEDEPKLKPGETIGQYRITKQIGHGGMGEVYLAEHTAQSREVALKILPAHFLDDAQRLQRFRQEARAVLALNHPNIVTVYDIGEAEGIHFISTEFVEGQTLRERIASARLMIEEAVEIVLQVASALAYAHERGIIHRDVKPENIMLRPDGYVKVLDFGIAKLTERKAGSKANNSNEALTRMKDHTTPGMVMGTVHYMSPEQARGLEVDERTDIFGLGVCLYEMLTGRLPFKGETASDVIADILKSEPAPLDANMPPELQRIVRKSLKKNAEERYQTAKDLLIDLKSIKHELDFTAKVERSAIPTLTTKAHKHQVRSKTIASLAVLPFINKTADADTEYLSDGISESIINSLSQLPKLRVMARSTVFRYKGQTNDPQNVGRDLGVRAILTGRISQMGDRLIINTELLDVVDGAQIWGERYNRKLTDIFEVQEEIAAEISEKLRLKLTSADRRRISKRNPENFEAYQLYLKGRYYWLNTRTEEGIRRSVEYFNRAIEVDPSYALAYTGLSDSYVVLGLSYIAPSIDILPQAKAAATEALRIDDTLAEAHASLSIIKLFIEWDWSGYERESKRAIGLNPNYATAYYEYAQYLTIMGRFDEAVREAKRARKLDPLALDINAIVGWSYYFARNYEEAIKQYRKVIEIDPEYFQAYRRLGMALLQRKQNDEAIAAIQKARSLAGNSVEELAYLGYAHAVLGQSKEAQKIIGELEEQSKSRYISPYLMALIYVGLGENDLAFGWLEKAYEARAVNLIWLNVEPIFDSLRLDPRYPPLLRRIGIAP